MVLSSLLRVSKVSNKNYHGTLRRAAEAFEHAGYDSWLDHAPAGSYAHLALLICGVRGLPPALSDELVTAFCGTWGEWSRDRRLGGAR